ncbi:MAG: hypothetical protein IH878_14040 [Gemmatimonadetes bacterium]|nr:hypothetical protein [Gemmatimonadota bacterium]
MELLDADWLSEGPIRLNQSLSLNDLSGCLVLNHARLVMGHMAANTGVKLTTTGNFNRKFVEQMVRDFRWPGFEPEVVWRFNRVLNEPDYVPVNFLHALINVAGLGRKHKGTFRLSRLGRSLLPPEAAGELNAVLFDATCNRYNLAYLDRRPIKESFQPQIGLTLFLMSKVAETPRSPEELLAITTLPIDPPQSDFPFHPEAIFRVRVLGYLEWFGLLEKVRIAANDQVGQQHLYRKTPLFDRFLSFDIEALIS